MDLLAERIEQYQYDGLTFDVIDSGPLDGKPFIFLHGFPETNQIWNDSAKILNQNGFRTFAVNQRGYSLGAQPKGRRAYSSQLLVADIKALIDLIGQSVYLMGHDWGAVVAWEITQRYPQLIQHLVTISVPHKAAFIRAMLSSNQLFKSYYIGLFQLPFIPEFLFEKVSALGQALLKDSGMTDKQLHDFKKEMIDENRIGYALNWYRGLPFSSNRYLTQPIKVPTLFIWGKHDTTIGIKGVKLNKNYIKAPYQEVIMDATHWIPIQNATELSRHILKHVT